MPSSRTPGSDPAILELPPWYAGTRGVVKPNRGSFGQGINAPGKPLKPPAVHVTVGSQGLRGRSSRWPTRHRMPARRAPHPDGREWKLNAESGSWRPRRLINWEAVHGPAPKGCIVRRLLPICDCESNLVLVTRSVNATAEPRVVGAAGQAVAVAAAGP